MPNTPKESLLLPRTSSTHKRYKKTTSDVNNSPLPEINRCVKNL